MLTDQEEQAEKLRVTLQDADVRRRQQEQSGTYLSQTHIDDAGGRFAAVNAATIVGQTPAPKYPAAGAHQADPVGTEPPLGFSVNNLESSTDLSAVEATGDPADAPLSDDGVQQTPSGGLMSERAGSSSSNKESA
jgi:hypothetical protein